MIYDVGFKMYDFKGVYNFVGSFFFCPFPFALCLLPFAFCPLPFALCPLPFAF